MGKTVSFNVTFQKQLLDALELYLNQKEEILGIEVPIKITRTAFIEDAVREKLVRETKDASHNN